MELYPVKAILLYIAIYILVTALSVPGAVWLTIAGGFLFAQPWATLYVVTGATTGAILLFCIAKSGLGDRLLPEKGGRLERMRQGFCKQGASYLLFLRLAPIFPFWLVNIAPAFLGVSLFTYSWTTLLGILPGAFVYAQLGASLDLFIAANGGQVSLASFWSLKMQLAFFGLALLALLPVFLKRYR